MLYLVGCERHCWAIPCIVAVSKTQVSTEVQCPYCVASEPIRVTSPNHSTWCRCVVAVVTPLAYCLVSMSYRPSERSRNASHAASNLSWSTQLSPHSNTEWPQHPSTCRWSLDTTPVRQLHSQRTGRGVVGCSLGATAADQQLGVPAPLAHTEGL